MKRTLLAILMLVLLGAVIAPARVTYAREGSGAKPAISATHLVFAPTSLINQAQAPNTLSTFEVVAEDATNSPDGSVTSIVLGVVSGPGGLAGQTFLLAPNGGPGVFIFTGTTLSTPGTYVLSASGGGLTTTPATDLTVVVNPSTLQFSTCPGASLVNVPFSTQPQVKVFRPDGSLDTSFNGPITVSIQANTGGAGAQLVGIKTVNAVNGVASFSGLNIDTAGTGYILVASDGAPANATCAPFNVAGPGLTFQTQPSNTTINMTIVPPVVVQINGANGLINSAYNGPVSVALKPGTGTSGAALTGTTTVNAVSGRATFSDLKVNTVGTGYVLTASAPGFPSVDSAPFDITTPTIGFTQNPTNTRSGQPISPPVQVTISGGSCTTVSIAIKAGTGNGAAHLSGTTTMPGGGPGTTVTFGDLSIDRAADGYQLIASCDGVAFATSTAFNILASKVVFLVEPAPIQQASFPLVASLPPPVVTPTPVITVAGEDITNNVAPNFNDPVQIKLIQTAPLPLSRFFGTNSKTASNGTVTFTDLVVENANPGYRLEICDPNCSFPSADVGFTSVTDSTPFNVLAHTACNQYTSGLINNVPFYTYCNVDGSAPVGLSQVVTNPAKYANDNEYGVLTENVNGQAGQIRLMDNWSVWDPTHAFYTQIALNAQGAYSSVSVLVPNPASTLQNPLPPTTVSGKGFTSRLYQRCTSSPGNLNGCRSVYQPVTVIITGAIGTNGLVNATLYVGGTATTAVAQYSKTFYNLALLGVNQ